ncbi:MAG: LemA family protein [Planctomycetota bacterium]|nr:LemA family protein [Planctomycetota bacterium]
MSSSLGVPMIIASGVATALGVVGVVIILAAIMVVSVYNSIQRGRIRAENAFSQIDVQLKRRCDLIPNLIETAKGYLTHERETLTAVIMARQAAVDGIRARAANPTDATATENLGAAAKGLDTALSRLMAVAEAYPDLKANQNMLAVQEELSTTENRIAFARQGYNDAVMRFNELLAVFPNNFIAGLFAFHPMAMFQANEGDRAVPSVRF